MDYRVSQELSGRFAKITNQKNPPLLGIFCTIVLFILPLPFHVFLGPFLVGPGQTTRTSGTHVVTVQDFARVCRHRRHETMARIHPSRFPGSIKRNRNVCGDFIGICKKYTSVLTHFSIESTVVVTWNCVNIGSGNGLLPDGTNPLPGSIWSCFYTTSIAFIQRK